jgi:uncharacterized membrane protein YfcA
LEIWQVLALLAAAVCIGWINNLAGAAGAIGLVVLQTLFDLDIKAANVSLRLSALTIGVAGMVGFLSRGQQIPARMWVLGLLTVPGALLGSYLALSLPSWVYRACLALVLVSVLIQQLRRSSLVGDITRRTPPTWLLVLLFSFVGLHMGFIQVGFGLVCILALSAIYSRNLVEINAAKMALVVVSAATSATSMAFSDEFKWQPAIVLGIGAGAGSFLASRWSVRKGHGAVRVVVIGICGSVLAWLGWQALAD